MNLIHIYDYSPITIRNSFRILSLFSLILDRERILLFLASARSLDIVISSFHHSSECNCSNSRHRHTFCSLHSVLLKLFHFQLLFQLYIDSGQQNSLSLSLLRVSLNFQVHFPTNYHVEKLRNEN